ncbi:MAG: sigma-E factor negative regulatory protein [Pseudomonadales bacterium]
MSSSPQLPLDKSESLSAVMDGASHELELHRLLVECANDAEMRKRWMRYQLVSTALHKQPTAMSNSLAFADAVRRAIDVEDRHGLSSGSVDNRSTPQRHRQTVTRVAVAASVALSVIVGAQWSQLRDDATSAQQIAKTLPTAQPINHSGVTPSPKTLVSVPSGLVAGNIFVQSGDVQSMRMNNPQGFENAALKTGRLQVPLINTAEQNFPRK